MSPRGRLIIDDSDDLSGSQDIMTACTIYQIKLSHVVDQNAMVCVFYDFAVHTLVLKG